MSNKSCSKKFGVALMVIGIIVFFVSGHFVLQMNDDLMRIVLAPDIGPVGLEAWGRVARGILPYICLFSFGSVFPFFIGLSFFKGEFLLSEEVTKSRDSKSTVEPATDA